MRISTLSLLLIFTFLGLSLKAQILNQNAAWPNTAWSITGSYTAGGLVNDPTTSSNYLFDDDAAGNGSVDAINAESPVIDLTSASAGGETWLTISTNFVYREIYGTLALEYWDAGASMWMLWEGLSPNSSNFDYQTCTGTIAFMSSILDISGWSATQLSGFKYRIAYDDAADWNWGFCFDSPTITSAAPPSCPDPTNLGVVSVTTNSATLFWTGSASATSYNVAIDTSGFLPSGSATVVTGSSTTVTGLMSGTSYDFYVQANCGTDTSNWVGPFTFTTIPDFCAGDLFYDTGGPNGTYSSLETTITTICPDNPGDIVQVTFTSFGIEANWDALYVYDGPDTNSTLLASSNGPTNSGFPAGGYYGTTPPGPFTSTDASGCLTFLFRSDASVTEDGWEASVICTGSASCATPTALSATNITSNSADLLWTGSGTVISYYVYVDTTGFTPTGSGTAVVASPYTATGLMPGTSYDFYVYQDCGFGVSALAGPFTFTTLAPCPVNVVLPNDTTICTSQSITLDAGSGPYTYFWSTGATTQTLLVDSASFGGAGIYTITVTLTDTVANCSDSDTIVVGISSCTGINNPNDDLEISLYPNPNNGLFVIDMHSSTLNDIEIRIYDNRGKLVYLDETIGSVHKLNRVIDMRKHPKGMYFLNIRSNTSIINQKIIIR